MATEILCLAEHREGKLRDVSFELAAAARALGGDDATVTGVLLCAPGGTLCAELARGAFQRVVCLEHAALADYTPDGYAQALRGLVEERRPLALLAAHTSVGWDCAPKLASALGWPLVSDIVDVRREGGEVLWTKNTWYRKLQAKTRIRRDPPWIATVQEGAFKAAPPGAAAPVECLPAKVDAAAIRWKVLGYAGAEKGAVDLTQAERIVSVGRGIKEKDRIPVVRELADALGAALGASRPLVDDGWLPREQQVGSSGKTVKPRLYIACGISGAIQHIVGMKGAEVIVAINKDGDAPIFQVAHYGIVGDIFEVVPKLTAKVKQVRGV